MVLDIAAYNKDNLQNAAGRLLNVPDPLSGAVENLRFMTNLDFGNTRGIDVRLDRRIGRLFNGTIAYTFQDSKNTGSDPDTYLDFGSRVINAVSGGLQPAHVGRRGVADLPGGLGAGDGDREHPAELGCVRDLPLRQRHAVHPLRRERG
jgi:hypothetical protein